MTAWRFNTDEAEEAGRGAADRMVLRSCIAAWGNGYGAEQMLSMPESGDLVFFYQNKVGVIAMATFDASAPFSSYEIFHKQQEEEFSRKVVGLVDRRTRPITCGQIKEATGTTFPAKGKALVRLGNAELVAFLMHTFQG